MTFGLSSLVYINERLTTAWLDKAASAGITHVELRCERRSFDYRDQGQVQDIARWLRDSPVRVESLFMPSERINLVERERIRRRAACDEARRFLEVLEHVPAPYVVMYLGEPGEDFDERKIDAGFSSLEELNVFARDRGAAILLENIPNEVSTPERLIRFLEITRLRNGICFDAGHANIGKGGVSAAWHLLSERVRLAHLHDNDGTRDAHLLPLMAQGGTVDWKHALRLLRAADPAPVAILEPMPLETADPLGAAAEAMSRLADIRTGDEEQR